jgi:hypothetical protein
MSLESYGGMILTGENWRTWRKTCPNATLSTSPKWIDPGANPGVQQLHRYVELAMQLRRGCVRIPSAVTVAAIG